MSFIHKHSERGWEPCSRKSEENRCPFGGGESHITLEPGVDAWAASERMNEHEGLNTSLKGKTKDERQHEAKQKEEEAKKAEEEREETEARRRRRDERKRKAEEEAKKAEESEETAEPETETSPEPEPTPEPKGKEEETLPKKKTKYSFLKTFKIEQEQFERDFGSYPKRFFNTNLRQKGKHTLLREEHVDVHQGEFHHVTLDLEEQIEVSKNKEELLNSDDPEDLWKVRAVNQVRTRPLSTHMLSAASAPDDNYMNTEEAREKVNELAAQIGDDAVVTELDDSDPEHKVLKSALGKKTERAWVISYSKDDPDSDFKKRIHNAHVAITDDTINNRGDSYSLRRGVGPIGRSEEFTLTDLRGLAGDARITHNSDSETGLLASKAAANRATTASQKKERSEAMTTKTLETLSSMEDSQGRGQNFLAQAKYVRDANSKVATAFDDKKNTPKTHIEVMNSTKLSKKNGGLFTSVELDGDVDLEEYKSFENDIMDVQDKLPQGAEDKMPGLRVRKLGKHSSNKKTVNGLFSPTKNTLVLDVNTSEAFVHEYGHHLDLVQKNNASLSEDFKGIHRDYSKDLKENDPKRASYLKTPTEALSRGFEIYAVEKLGINNRLVNSENFANNDYQPFMEPEKKQRLFDFFDKMFKD